MNESYSYYLNHFNNNNTFRKVWQKGRKKRKIKIKKEGSKGNLGFLKEGSKSKRKDQKETLVSFRKDQNQKGRIKRKPWFPLGFL